MNQNFIVTLIAFLIASSVVVIHCSMSSISRAGLHENKSALSLSKRQPPGTSSMALRVYKRGIGTTSKDLSLVGNDFEKATEVVNPMNLVPDGPEQSSFLETGRPSPTVNNKIRGGKFHRRMKRNTLEVGTHKALSSSPMGDGHYLLNQASSLPKSENPSKQIKLRIPIR